MYWGTDPPPQPPSPPKKIKKSGTLSGLKIVYPSLQVFLTTIQLEAKTWKCKSYTKPYST